MRRLPRICIPPDRFSLSVTKIALLPKEQHYLLHVLRLTEGSLVSVFDGQGHSAVCSLTASPGGNYDLCISLHQMPPQKDDSLSHAMPEIVLALGLLKNDKFDFVVEKATELGVCRIIPLHSKRVNVTLDAHRIESRRSRWNRIAESAAGQCGRLDVPEIDKVTTFTEVQMLSGMGTKLICWELEKEPRTLPSLLKDKEITKVTLFVGPEGGFSTEEIELALRQGCHACTLGPRILRAETAALASVAAASILLQENFLKKTLR